MTEPPFDMGDDGLGPDDTGFVDESAPRSGLRRGRTALRWGAILVAIILIVIGSSALITSIFESRRSTTQRFGDTIDRIVVMSDNGEISVTAVEGTEIVIERDERYVFRRPSRDADLKGTTLVLGDGCPSFNILFLGGCRVDFRLTVPAGVSIDLDSSNGDLVVEGITGGVVLHTSNGDVDLDRLSGEVDAETSNGSIIGRSLTSPSVHADTSNGRITLIFDEPPDRVVADTSNGNIDIEVPAMPYRIDADTSNGDIDLDVVSDPDAARTIDARSSNGDIEIRRR
jgi:hypothetical protein